MHSLKESPLKYLFITKGATVSLQWRNPAETTLPKRSQGQQRPPYPRDLKVSITGIHIMNP